MPWTYEQRKENRRKLIERGLCIICSKKPSITTGRYQECYECYLKRSARINLGDPSRWYELHVLWEKQKGICPYTGKCMTLGVDSSIDHIMPKQRYPHLSKDSSNLEWVDYSVNMMKRDRTKEEFLALCSSIVDYNQRKEK